eukprot:1153665-Pelagomonas_calceolata.AAC.6
MGRAGKIQDHLHGQPSCLNVLRVVTRDHQVHICGKAHRLSLPAVPICGKAHRLSLPASDYRHSCLKVLKAIIRDCLPGHWPFADFGWLPRTELSSTSLAHSKSAARPTSNPSAKREQRPPFLIPGPSCAL